MKVNVFWFRRDLRFDDNKGLNAALKSGLPLLPIFIFDKRITDELEKDDPRINFIHEKLSELNNTLVENGSSLKIFQGNPLEIWKKIIEEQPINEVFFNHDYEPYALERDKEITSILEHSGISVSSFKDQVIFEKNEVLKDDGSPYTVFTPYKKRWLSNFKWNDHLPNDIASFDLFQKTKSKFPSLEQLGFSKSKIQVKPFDLSAARDYKEKRDIPSLDHTSYLSPHLRFGTISVRRILRKIGDMESTFTSELIWREFFMQILYHFPNVVHDNFKKKYDGIKWRNNEEEFKKWCEGKTGYPMVDAGMRQLNKTGYMHNRVRMITAGFLCKHLLIDWRWGEAYFAKKLLDFELSSNNGNWQWAAGTGCDAAPYFRIFNPIEQLKKFDSEYKYVRKWIPELNELTYPTPIVDHKSARERALSVYKEGIG